MQCGSVGSKILVLFRKRNGCGRPLADPGPTQAPVGTMVIVGYRCFITLNLGFWFRLWIFGQKPSTCSEIRNIDSLTYAPIRRYELSNPRRCKGCVLANIQIRSRPQLGHNLFEDLAAYSRLPAQIYAKNPATPRTPGRPARNLNMLVQNGSTRVHDSGTWRRE